MSWIITLTRKQGPLIGVFQCAWICVWLCVTERKRERLSGKSRPKRNAGGCLYTFLPFNVLSLLMKCILDYNSCNNLLTGLISLRS